MEELQELRGYIEGQQYHEALNLIEEMEEMSRSDKINKIGSFIKILLIHLIKQQAEKRTTRSWDTSIFNALFEIKRINKRRKTKGFYIKQAEMYELIDDYYSTALRYASLEAFGGRYEADELETMFDQNTLQQKAVDLLQTTFEYKH